MNSGKFVVGREGTGKSKVLQEVLADLKKTISELRIWEVHRVHFQFRLSRVKGNIRIMITELFSIFENDGSA